METGWSESRSFDRYSIHYEKGPALRDEAEAWLVRGLIRAMPELKVEAYFQAKGRVLRACDHLVIATEKRSGELIAALGSSWHHDGGHPFFLHTVILLITERYRRTNLIKHLWGMHMGKVSQGPHGFPSLIVLRTCNPLAFHAMRVFTRIPGVRMYPELERGTQSPEMVALAQRVAERICPGLEVHLDTGVIRNAGVPPDFYAALPKTSKKNIGSYFERHLTPADRLLCILSVPLEPAKQRILKAIGAEVLREEKPCRLI